MKKGTREETQNSKQIALALIWIRNLISSTSFCEDAVLWNFKAPSGQIVTLHGPHPHQVLAALRI